MPTYEYRCRACDHEFERFQKISAAPVRTCPECKKRRVERLISTGGGIVFKGTGLYATDYRSPTETAAREKGSRSEERSTKSGGSKDDGTQQGTSKNKKKETKAEKGSSS